MDTILGGLGASNAMPAGGLIKDSSTTNFQADVLDASVEVPVLVDFWAPWCGPCKQLGPALEKAVTAAGGKVKLVKINVDENQELSGQMGVKSIPAVFAFSGGQPIDGFMGAIPESEINRFIDKITAVGAGGGADNDFDAQVKAALDTAEQALMQGESEQASQIYTMILQQFPDDGDAILGMANVHLATGQLDEARQLCEAVSEDIRGSDKFAALERAIELAAEAEGLGEKDDLRARIAASPDDHQARIDLAMLLNAEGNRLEAAESLIASFKIDRDWNEGAARAKLLEFFEAWGPADPATVKGRRLLSAVLFS